MNVLIMPLAQNAFSPSRILRAPYELVTYRNRLAIGTASSTRFTMQIYWKPPELCNDRKAETHFPALCRLNRRKPVIFANVWCQTIASEPSGECNAPWYSIGSRLRDRRAHVVVANAQWEQES